jgi:integrase
MSKAHRQKGQFHKVGECLYRYSSSEVYYARFKHESKVILRSLLTTDLALAKRRLREMREKTEKTDTVLSSESFQSFVLRYLETIHKFDKSTQTQKRGIANRLTHDKPDFLSKRIGEIKPSEVEVWLTQQLKREISASTFNHYLTFLRNVFGLAVRDRAILNDPTTTLVYRKSKRPLPVVPNPKQFDAIVEDIRSQRFNADAEESANFVEFLGLSGLGNSEAANLKWKDIDWQRNKIGVYRNKTDVGFEIPIYPQLRPFLEKLKKLAQPELSESLFKIRNARKAIASACRRLGFPLYGHRSFRKMFITRCIELGIDPKVIASWQGHRDGGVLIMQTYGHLRQEHADKMAELLIA